MLFRDWYWDKGIRTKGFGLGLNYSEFFVNEKIIASLLFQRYMEYPLLTE